MSEKKVPYMAHVQLPGLKKLFTNNEIKPRPEINWFAKRMENKLRQNDHKPHWSKADYEYFLHRIYQEMNELIHAINKGETENIIDESADVANFAMMIADNAGVIVKQEKCKGCGFEHGFITDYDDSGREHVFCGNCGTVLRFTGVMVPNESQAFGNDCPNGTCDM